jgi:RNA polymerase primary sigma factor
VRPPDSDSGFRSLENDADHPPHLRSVPALAQFDTVESHEAKGDSEYTKALFADEKLSGPLPDAVRAYLNRIGRVSLLKAVEEVELAKEIEAGLFARELQKGTVESPMAPDPKDVRYIQELEEVARRGDEAKTRFIEANLRFPVNIAKRYTKSVASMQFLDLIQAGNIGMAHALEKFDYTKGYKFSTYAMWWVRQTIEREIANDDREIRIPVHMLEKVNKINRARRDLNNQLQREPTSEELALVTEMPAEKIKEVLEFSHTAASLNMPVGDDGTAEFGDLIPDTETIQPLDAALMSQKTSVMEYVLDLLPEREKTIVRLRLGFVDGEPKTLDYIGGVLGLTRERIRQLEKVAFTKLKRPDMRALLEDYMDE